MARVSRGLRRLISIPTLVLAFFVLVGLLPILPLLAVIDGLRRRTGLPSVRLYAMALGFVVVDLVSVTALGWVGLTRWRHRDQWIERNIRIQLWWVEALARGARRLADLRFVVSDPDGALERGGVVALCRHVSYADAILPALLFGVEQQVLLRYVLMSGLQADPALDIAAHRLPNHFVDRRPDDNTPELEALRELASGIRDDAAGVIFPEGNFFSAKRLTRAVDHLDRTGSVFAGRAAKLRHVLPPRPGGALALLEGAPAADVAIIAHAGLESFGSVLQLWRNLPLRKPVKVEVWRTRRSDIPGDPEGQRDWIFTQWERMDGWIDDQVDAVRDQT